jgi:hypothetical protein
VKPSPRTLLIAAALSVAGLAHAAQPVSLLLPVSYEYATSVLNKTKESCKLQDKLATDIGGEIQKRAGRPGTATGSEGVTLRVTILGSGGIGGGGWTGSKSLTVRVEELTDGEPVRSRSFIRKSRGGFAGPFEGTCAILEVSPRRWPRTSSIGAARKPTRPSTTTWRSTRLPRLRPPNRPPATRSNDQPTRKSALRDNNTIN